MPENITPVDYSKSTTEELIKDLLVYIHDGNLDAPDFQPILQECRKRLGLEN